MFLGPNVFFTHPEIDADAKEVERLVKKLARAKPKGKAQVQRQLKRAKSKLKETRERLTPKPIKPVYEIDT